MDKKDIFNQLLIDNLPEDKLKEFERLRELGDTEKTQEFIGSILPDIEKILEANLKEFNKSSLERFHDY